MKMDFRIAAVTVLALGLGAAGCGDSGSGALGVETIQIDAALSRARSSADELGGRLMTALVEQLEGEGPVPAIRVCSEVAPAAAGEISRNGLEIRRTSLRFRSPRNSPDPWERAWLERLEESHARGELPKDIHEVDRSHGELRYLRPIVVAPQCLQCHGAEDELDPDVREQLAQAYPDDRATGFSAGDLRGAFSVRVGLGGPDAG